MSIQNALAERAFVLAGCFGLQHPSHLVEHVLESEIVFLANTLMNATQSH